MGRKKKVSTQPEEVQLQFDKEENPNTPNSMASGENSIGGEASNSQTGEEKGSSTNVDGNSNKKGSSKGRASAKDKKDPDGGEWEKKHAALSLAAYNMPKMVEELGGMDAVRSRLALSRALFLTYKNRGNSLQEIVDSVLTEYRNEVSQIGYKGITEDMIPVVETYGTIKDKTSLIVLAYWDCKKVEGEKNTLITRKAVDRIREEIKTHGIEAMKEFMRYLNISDAIRASLNHVYRIKFTYLNIAKELTLYLQNYEWICKTEEILNSVSPLVGEDKQQELNNIIADYRDNFQKNIYYGKLEETPQGKLVEASKEDCLLYAQSMVEVLCTSKLSQLKGAIKAVEKWIKDNKAEMFVPMAVLRELLEVEVYTIPNLQDKYFLSHLAKLEEKGITPTEKDKALAMYPSYADVEPDEEILTNLYKYIDGKKREI